MPQVNVYAADGSGRVVRTEWASNPRITALQEDGMWADESGAWHGAGESPDQPTPQPPQQPQQPEGEWGSRDPILPASPTLPPTPGFTYSDTFGTGHVRGLPGPPGEPAGIQTISHLADVAQAPEAKNLSGAMMMPGGLGNDFNRGAEARMLNLLGFGLNPENTALGERFSKVVSPDMARQLRKKADDIRSKRFNLRLGSVLASMVAMGVAPLLGPAVSTAAAGAGTAGAAAAAGAANAALAAAMQAAAAMAAGATPDWKNLALSTALGGATGGLSGGLAQTGMPSWAQGATTGLSSALARALMTGNFDPIALGMGAGSGALGGLGSRGTGSDLDQLGRGVEGLSSSGMSMQQLGPLLKILQALARQAPLVGGGSTDNAGFSEPFGLAMLGAAAAERRALAAQAAAERRMKLAQQGPDSSAARAQWEQARQQVEAARQRRQQAIAESQQRRQLLTPRPPSSSSGPAHIEWAGDGNEFGYPSDDAEGSTDSFDLEALQQWLFGLGQSNDEPLPQSLPQPAPQPEPPQPPDAGASFMHLLPRETFNMPSPAAKRKPQQATAPLRGWRN